MTTPVLSQSSSRQRQLRAPIHNPYDKFTKPEFDAWIDGITGALRRALGHEDDILEPDANAHTASLENDSEVEDHVEEEEEIVEIKSQKAKGKQRDPREGPGLGGSRRVEQQYFPVSESESEGEDDEGDDDDFEGSSEEYARRRFRWLEDSEDASEAEVEVEFEEEEEEETSGGSPERAIELLSSDDEAAANGVEEEDEVPGYRLRDDEEEEGSGEHEETYDFEDGDHGPSTRLVDYTGDDEDAGGVYDDGWQKMDEQDTVPAQPMQPVELEDPWTGPRTFAEDFYADGDAPSQISKAMRPDVISLDDDEVVERQDLVTEDDSLGDSIPPETLDDLQNPRIESELPQPAVIPNGGLYLGAIAEDIGMILTPGVGTPPSEEEHDLEPSIGVANLQEDELVLLPSFSEDQAQPLELTNPWSGSETFAEINYTGNDVNEDPSLLQGSVEDAVALLVDLVDENASKDGGLLPTTLYDEAIAVPATVIPEETLLVEYVDSNQDLKVVEESGLPLSEPDETEPADITLTEDHIDTESHQHVIDVVLPEDDDEKDEDLPSSSLSVGQVEDVQAQQEAALEDELYGDLEGFNQESEFGESRPLAVENEFLDDGGKLSLSLSEGFSQLEADSTRHPDIVDHPLLEDEREEDGADMRPIIYELDSEDEHSQSEAGGREMSVATTAARAVSPMEYTVEEPVSEGRLTEEPPDSNEVKPTVSVLDSPEAEMVRLVDEVAHTPATQLAVSLDKEEATAPVEAEEFTVSDTGVTLPMPFLVGSHDTVEEAASLTNDGVSADQPLSEVSKELSNGKDNDGEISHAVPDSPAPAATVSEDTFETVMPPAAQMIADVTETDPSQTLKPGSADVEATSQVPEPGSTEILKNSDEELQDTAELEGSVPAAESPVPSGMESGLPENGEPSIAASESSSKTDEGLHRYGSSDTDVLGGLELAYPDVSPLSSVLSLPPYDNDGVATNATGEMDAEGDDDPDYVTTESGLLLDISSVAPEHDISQRATSAAAGQFVSTVEASSTKESIQTDAVESIDDMAIDRKVSETSNRLQATTTTKSKVIDNNNSNIARDGRISQVITNGASPSRSSAFEPDDSVIVIKKRKRVSKTPASSMLTRSRSSNSIQQPDDNAIASTAAPNGKRKIAGKRQSDNANKNKAKGKGKGKGKEIENNSDISFSSSGASSASRLVQFSRSSSVVSSAPSAISSGISQPSPSLRRQASAPKIVPSPLRRPTIRIHTHSHVRPSARPITPRKEYSQPQLPPTPSQQTRVSPAQSSSQTRAEVLIVSSPTSTSQHQLQQNVSANSSPVTRSQCRFHRIRLLWGTPHAYFVHFVVPGCALGDRELMKEIGFEDCGDASYEDHEHMVGDLSELEETDGDLLGVLRHLVGVDLLREQEVFYLPQVGDELLERIRALKRSGAGAGAGVGGKTSPLSKFASREEVETANNGARESGDQSNVFLSLAYPDPDPELSSGSGTSSGSNPSHSNGVAGTSSNSRTGNGSGNGSGGGETRSGPAGSGSGSGSRKRRPPESAATSTSVSSRSTVRARGMVNLRTRTGAGTGTGMGMGKRVESKPSVAASSSASSISSGKTSSLSSSASTSGSESESGSGSGSDLEGGEGDQSLKMRKRKRRKSAANTETEAVSTPGTLASATGPVSTSTSTAAIANFQTANHGGNEKLKLKPGRSKRLGVDAAEYKPRGGAREGEGGEDGGGGDDDDDESGSGSGRKRKKGVKRTRTVLATDEGGGGDGDGVGEKDGEKDESGRMRKRRRKLRMSLQSVEDNNNNS